MNCLSACKLPPLLKHCSSSESGAFGQRDGLLWHNDFIKLVNGEFSMAVLQANTLLEDQSQIESGSLSLMDSGPFGSFVGVYDGHGGPEAARYITKHLFGHIKKFSTDQRSMSVDVIRKAIQATEDGFLSLVSQQWPLNHRIASVGSCCLVGIVCEGTIYVSSLGDSRAVLGRLVRATGEVLALQLSAEHNASIESVRKELRSLHPHDSKIVVLKHNVWRVKGLIQISRSIGDAFLKNAKFNERLDAKFRLQESFVKPILSSEPEISEQTVHPDDKFVIFASDGLWELISNQDAVNIVQNRPRKGIARRLVKTALLQAAKKREMRYCDLIKIDKGVRRHFHDDITVAVFFLDLNLNDNRSSREHYTVSLIGGS